MTGQQKSTKSTQKGTRTPIEKWRAKKNRKDQKNSIYDVQKRKRDLPLVILGPPNDCSMITFRPMQDTSANQDVTTGASKSKQTFRPKRNTDSVCKHVNAIEDARAGLVGELDFLVGTASQNRASGLSGSATEGTRRRRRDVMHGRNVRVLRDGE